MKKDVYKNLKFLTSLWTWGLAFLLSVGLNQVQAQQNVALNLDANDNMGISNISLAGDYTLEAWFLSPLPANIYCTLFRGTDHHPVLTENNILGVYNNSSVSFLSSGFNMASLSAGWHHVAAVGTGTTTTFYIDGVFVGTSAFKSNSDIRSIGNFQGLNQPFGTIDEVRIWNDIRSPVEIQANMFRELTGSEPNLVAYYNFQEGSPNADNTGISAPEIQDQVGSNDGTMTVGFAGNGSSSNWVNSFTFPQNALDFDGTDDFVFTNSGFDHDVNNFTVEAWVYPRTLKQSFFVAQGGYGCAQGWLFDMPDANGTLRLETADASTCQGTVQTGTGAIVANQWQHIAVSVTRGASGNLTKMYINGVEVASGNIPAGDLTQSQLVVGWGMAATNAQRFDGLMDEVRIWNVARSCDDIRSTMNTELVGDESSLVTYYNFNQGFAGENNAGLTTLDDLTANNIDGTLNNFALSGASSNWVDGSANGVSGTTPEVPAEINVQGNSVNIMSGDFSPEGLDDTSFGVVSDQKTINYTIQNSGDQVLNISSITSDNGAFVVGNAPVTVAASSSETFTITFTPGTTGTATITINSNDCDEGTYTFTVGATVVGAAPEITLKANGLEIPDGYTTIANSVNTDFGNVFSGASQALEYSIFNNGSADLTISSIISSGTDAADFVVSNAPTTVPAYSEAVFTVTFTPSATGTRTATLTINSDDADEAAYDFAVQGTSSLNNALNFDGMGDYVSVPYNAGLDISGTLTLEAWVNRNTSGVFNNIVLKGNYGYGFILDNNNQLGYWSNSNYGVCPRFGTITSNIWTHVAVVVVENTSVTFYINGVQVGQTADPTEATINSGGANDLFIGTQGTVLGNYFNGDMDEVRIWSTARSCAEIQANMNRELTGSETGLLAYYNFNQGVAGGNNTGLTTLTDGAGSNDGTLTNFTGLGGGTTSNWVNGSTLDAGVPQIWVRGNAVPLSNGDTSPASEDGTDFGGASTGSPITKSFNIKNLGEGTLSISNITNSNTSDFTLGALSFPIDIAPNSSVNIELSFDPQSLGLLTSTLSITDNTCAGSFTFDIAGTGLPGGTVENFRGQAIAFDNSTTQSVTLLAQSPASINFNANENFSIEAWVRQDSPGPGAIFSNQMLVPPFSGYNLAITTAGRLSLTLTSSVVNPLGAPQGGDVVLVVSSDATALFADANWHHVAATYDASGNAAGISLYLDGVLLAPAAGSPNTIDQLVSSDNIQTSMTNPLMGLGLHGAVDEVRIWNDVRTADEIRRNIHFPLQGNEANLVSYYQFNEASTAIVDKIGALNALSTGTSEASGIKLSDGELSIHTVTSNTLINAAGGLDIQFIDANPNGDLYVSYLPFDENYELDGPPSNGINQSSGTWLINNYGTLNSFNAQLTFNLPANQIINLDPSAHFINKRDINSTSDGDWVSQAISEVSIDPVVMRGNVTSFSEVVLTSSASPLPITLLSFEASRLDESEVRLDWTTATEINNLGFEIEMSEDAQNFEKVGFVEGAGESSTLRNYTFKLENTAAAYYRLKQMDIGGDFTYSTVRFVEAQEESAAEFGLYPNPSSGVIHLQGYDQDVQLNLRVINAQGKVIWERRAKFSELESQLNQGFLREKSGLYYIQVQDAQGIQTQKWIKY